MNLHDQPTNPTMLTQYGPIDPTALDKAEITIEQAASVLSKICRYGGHSSRFYSVAEHSIHCAAIAKNHLGLPPHKVLYMLCHDVGETIVGDVIRPVKKFMPDEILEAENTLLDDFIKRLPFTGKQLAEVNDPMFINLVRFVDTRMAVTEIKHLFGVDANIAGHAEYKDFYMMREYNHKDIALYFMTTFDNLIEKLGAQE